MEGIEWMKEKQRIVEEASSVLVVGVVLWVFVSFRRSMHRTMDIDDEPQNSQRILNQCTPVNKSRSVILGDSYCRGSIWRCIQKVFLIKLQQGHTKLTVFSETK